MNVSENHWEYNFGHVQKMGSSLQNENVIPVFKRA